MDAVSGAWGTIIPNDLAGGVQRIEQRRLSDGGLIFANTDSDGLWPSGANTVNPSGSDTNAIVITSSDAPLIFVAPQITYLALNSISFSNLTNVVVGGTNTGAGTFYLLASTDLTIPKPNWISVATNNSGGSGNFSLTATNVVSPGNPQRFFILSTTNNLP